MSNNKPENIVYSPAVIEFVAVCVEFCALLEKEETLARNTWTDKMLKMLPLMYLKASLLPETEIKNQDSSPETFVKEEDYVRVAAAVTEIMGDENVYLDVFVEDMKYSERPISAFVSENIADIYQDVRNFVSVYQYGLSEQMNDALCICTHNFRTYWGQQLLNVLRPLHKLHYGEGDNDIFSDDNIERNDLWD